MKKQICALLLCLAALFSLGMGIFMEPILNLLGAGEGAERTEPGEGTGPAGGGTGLRSAAADLHLRRARQPGVSILFRHLEYPAQYPDPGAAVLHRHQLRLCARRLAAGTSHL